MGDGYHDAIPRQERERALMEADVWPSALPDRLQCVSACNSIITSSMPISVRFCVFGRVREIGQGFPAQSVRDHLTDWHVEVIHGSGGKEFNTWDII